MSFKIICGPTGSGKTTRAIHAFLAAVDRGDNPVFIAPSGPDARHFHRRVLDHRPVLTGGEVTTFAGLHAEFLSGDESRPRIITAGERFMFLRAVVDGPGRPDKLTDSAGFDGFVSQLGNLINELRELHVGPAKLGEELKRWAGRDSWRRGLNRDLYRLYQEYEAALKEQGAEDQAQAALRAIDNLGNDNSLLKHHTVVIDGFYDFTPLELDLMNLLRQTAGNLVVTLPYQEANPALFAPGHYFDLLSPAADEVERLPGRAPENKTIGFIADNLFNEDAGQIDARKIISTLVAAGERGQAELVGAEILRLCREEKTGLDDIAVVCRETGADSQVMASTFAEFGIPFEINAQVPLMDTPLGRTAISALDVVAGGSRESFVSYLKSPFSGLDQDEVDDFDRVTRRSGIKTCRELMSAWSERSSMPLEEISQMEEAARQSPGRLAAVLLKTMRARVQQVCSRCDSIEELEMDSASLNCLVEVCEAATLIGDKFGLEPGLPPEQSAPESQVAGAVKLLRSGIINASAGLQTGKRRNCVRLLDPHRVLNQRFDVVFICGLLEGRFPRGGRENSFLSDSDRDWLRENAGLAFDDGDLALAKERFLFHRTLTRARRKVYLCHPYCDKEGKPTIRSLFVDDTLDLFHEKSWGGLKKKINDMAFAGAAAPTPGQALLSLASQNNAYGHGVSVASSPLLAAARPAGLEARLTAVLEASASRVPQINDETKECFRDQEFFKVTDLEQYLKCPFRFFIEKVIRPQSMEPEKFVLARGAAVHGILDKFFSALKPAGLVLSREKDEGRISEARRIMAEIIQQTLGDGDPDLRTAISRVELAGSLDRFIQRERQMRPEFTPHKWEWVFGICDGKPTGLSDEETMLKFGDVKLCGRIDRVDIRQGSNQAIVIDYKTSSDANLPPQAKFRETGTLQVPLYMLALRDIWGLEPIGGEYYGILGKRRRGLYLAEFSNVLGKESGEIYKTEFVEQEVFDQRLEEAKESALKAAGGIRAGSFECEPLDPRSCNRCWLGDICRQGTHGSAADAQVGADG